MSDQPLLKREEGRGRIEHEDNLINHRFSWLIMSQSFLLTAFVLLRNHPDLGRPNRRSAVDRFLDSRCQSCLASVWRRRIFQALKSTWTPQWRPIAW